MYIYMNAHIYPRVYLLSQALLLFSINMESIILVLSREVTGLFQS